jgi:hypothetical protein
VRERSIVEIRRADRRPQTVDHHDLVVHHRAVVFIELDARIEERAVEAHAVVARHQRVVADACHHDAHAHAALRGIPEQIDRDVIRNKVRIRDIDRVALRPKWPGNTSPGPVDAPVSGELMMVCSASVPTGVSDG